MFVEKPLAIDEAQPRGWPAITGRFAFAHGRVQSPVRPVAREAQELWGERIENRVVHYRVNAIADQRAGTPVLKGRDPDSSARAVISSTRCR